VKTRETKAPREHLAPAVREMVRRASRSMGFSIEIWSGPGRPQERVHLGPACSACEHEDGKVFDRCRKRRSYLARPDANVPTELTEKCAMKLRLARLGDDPGGPVLFAFGYAPPANESSLRDDRVLSFLRDLRTLLHERTDVALPAAAGGRSEELELMQSVSGPVSGPVDYNAASIDVLNEWRETLYADCAFIWLEDRDTLRFSFAERCTLKPGDGYQRWALFARRLVETLRHHPGRVHAEELPSQHPLAQELGGALRCIAVPLVIEGRIQGLVCGLKPTIDGSFDAARLKLLRSLGGQLALAVANGKLAEDLKSFLTNTVKSLISAIDAKDSYTSGHSERVNIVSMLIGNEMDLDLADLEALYWGALLHDVGKIGMPETILKKPCALNENEYEIVKEHPERGFKMLHCIDQLRRATDGVRYHHERWDGGGYPKGIGQQDIPVIARIVAVADAFDAIISNRTYRLGRSPQQAVEIIAECAGTQFDPEVVATLRKLLPLLEKHQWVLLSGQKVSVAY
jgi:hypothetical protein